MNLAFTGQVAPACEAPRAGFAPHDGGRGMGIDGVESCATPRASARPGNRDDRHLRGSFRGVAVFSMRRLRKTLRLRAGKKGLARRRAEKRRADQERFASEAWCRDGG